MITSIKHSSRLHHPSLEAEYAWRLAQIPYCEIITQQKDFCALQLWQDLKFFSFLSFFLFFFGKVDYLFSAVSSC